MTESRFNGPSVWVEDRERSAAAIAALEEALGKMTPTPWTVEEDHGRDFTGEGWSRIDVAMGDGGCAMGDHESALEDAQGIVLLRNAVPALLKIAVHCHRAHNLADELAELATAVLGAEEA